MNDARETPPTLTNDDPVEIAMDALARGDGALGDPARRLLLRQTRLIEIQIQQLWLRRWLYGALVALVVLIAGAVLRSAWSDHSLVIESFAVPPDLQAQGLDGEVLASLMLDRLSAIDRGTESLRARETLTNAWSGDIKVEIPNTGISLGQIDRGLRHWLGRQSHIEGMLFHRGDALVLVVRADAGAHRFEGAASDLDALLQQGAEALFEDTQPYLFSKYLEQHGRFDESLAVARRASLSGSDDERAWNYAQISNLLSWIDAEGAIEAGYRALKLDPQNALAYLNISTGETLLGHDEDGVRHIRDGARLLESGRGGLSALGVTFGLINDAIYDDFTGDYAGAAAIYAGPVADVSYQGYDRLMPGLVAYELAKNHDVAAARQVHGVRLDEELIGTISLVADAILPAYEMAAAVDDWPAAIADLDRVDAAAAAAGYDGQLAQQRFLQPRRAWALARSGHIDQAQALIAATPADCYRCVHQRGRIAALAGDAAGADRWFAEAIRQAPSQPFAYAEWGEARLARGDADGALVLLRQAQDRAPRWAEAFKLEGDALVHKNALAQACARYAQAADRAPHWGALQLAWARALTAQNRSEEARQKLVAAAGMELSATDRAVVTQQLGHSP